MGSKRKEIELGLSKNKQLADAYDRVIVKMHLQKQQYGKSVFLICGTDPKVGTTTCAKQLAVGLSKSGKKVVLLDTDMRKTLKEKKIEGDYKETLAEYLMKDITVDSILYPTESEKLSVIPGGISTDPVQLLCSDKMKELIECIKEMFDYVIIDSPSMGAAADANAIFSLVDQVILVVAPERSYKKQMLDCYEYFKKYEVDLLGVIVNRIDKYGYRDYMKNADYYTGNYKNNWDEIMEWIQGKQKAITKKMKRKEK